MSYKQMSTYEFHQLIDDLEIKYMEYKLANFQGSILEFLDNEIGGDRSYYKEAINYLDILRELNSCNIAFTIENKDGSGHWNYSDRFRILMGIIENVEYSNRPTPKFKKNDILLIKNGSQVIFIDEESDNNYYFTYFNGETDFASVNEIEELYHKIGEVTKDVILEKTKNKS